MKPEEYTTGRLLKVLQSTQGSRMQRLSGFEEEDPALQEWLSSTRRQITNADVADILRLSQGAVSEIFHGQTLPRDMISFVKGISGLCRLSPVEKVVFTSTLSEDLLRRKDLWPVIMTPEKGVSAALIRRVTAEEYQTMRRDFFAHGVITTS